MKLNFKEESMQWNIHELEQADDENERANEQPPYP